MWGASGDSPLAFPLMRGFKLHPFLIISSSVKFNFAAFDLRDSPLSTMRDSGVEELFFVQAIGQ
jgi:hypothetical protein